jgi:hypothetical protein
VRQSQNNKKEIEDIVRSGDGVVERVFRRLFGIVLLMSKKSSTFVGNLQHIP